MSRGTFRVIVREEAEADIRDAAVWYEEQTQELGQQFLDAVDSAIQRAAQNPFAHACLRRNPEVRRVLTKRFPYRIFFVRRQDAIVIFRVLHGSRDDREWTSTVPK